VRLWKRSSYPSPGDPRRFGLAVYYIDADYIDIDTFL
jgi:hypothetical protein